MSSFRAHGTAHLSICLAALDLVSLVEPPFPFSDGEFELYESVFSVHPNRDQSQALNSRFSYERADFRTAEEELSRTAVLMPGIPVRELVWRDERV